MFQLEVEGEPYTVVPTTNGQQKRSIPNSLPPFTDSSASIADTYIDGGGHLSPSTDGKLLNPYRTGYYATDGTVERQWVQSLYGNPNIGSTVTAWGTGEVSSAMWEFTGPDAAGQPFLLYGRPYSRMSISWNGYITLESDQTAAANNPTALPNEPVAEVHDSAGTVFCAVPLFLSCLFVPHSASPPPPLALPLHSRCGPTST